jgi:hypothetical protein
MSMTLPRRQFLRVCGAAALATLPVRLIAEEKQRLTADDPLAVALAYVEDATQVDAEAQPTFKPGSNCANCTLYVKAQEADGYAPCGAVGGKWVAGAGWCKAWVA